MRNGRTFHDLRIDDQSRILSCPRLYLRIRTQQTLGRFAGNLRHLQRVGQPCAVIISGACTEYL